MPSRRTFNCLSQRSNPTTRAWIIGRPARECGPRQAWAAWRPRAAMTNISAECSAISRHTCELLDRFPQKLRVLGDLRRRPFDRDAPDVATFRGGQHQASHCDEAIDV